MQEQIFNLIFLILTNETDESRTKTTDFFDSFQFLIFVNFLTLTKLYEYLFK